MNSSSKVIMAATMVMVVSLVMVLSLVLILLVELYCSLLFRRRRSRNCLSLPTTTTAVSAAATTTTLAQTISTTEEDRLPSTINPLTTGVLQTPETYFQTKNQNLSPDNDSVDHFIYISNPIYSNEAATPFETPESSPSRLETEDSSSESEISEDSGTPALTPMKGLPEKACSVSLKSVESLETSGSESNSNRKDGGSTSSSASQYTSPSW